MVLYWPLTGRCYRRELWPLANCCRQILFFASFLCLELCTSICCQLRCRLRTRRWVLQGRHCFSHRWQRLEDFPGSRSCKTFLRTTLKCEHNLTYWETDLRSCNVYLKWDSRAMAIFSSPIPTQVILEAVASWLVRSSPDRAVLVRALAGNTVLCYWARNFTLSVPLSTLEFKLVPANLEVHCHGLASNPGGGKILLLALCRMSWWAT